MRKWVRVVCGVGMSAVLAASLSACAAKAPSKATAAAADATHVPTVPPTTATPLPEPSALPTRSVGKKDVQAKKGEPIGPVITFFGAAKADGTKADPASVDKDGTRTYETGAGAGFIIVVEAKPGKSGAEVARRVFAYVPGDPHTRPDLEIESNHDMGNGSPAVCDRQRPNVGGMPGINPPSFAETQKVSDAINDLACRFETFIQSDSSCTMSPNGDYAFSVPDTTTQFCMLVAHAYAFPDGYTLLSVRLRDVDGNPGPVAHLKIRRVSPKPKKEAAPQKK
jgi:hypothetical protein